jgi:hypothetical protein
MVSRKEYLQEGRQTIKQAGKSIKQYRGIFLLLIVVNLVWSCRMNPEIQVKCQGYQRACLEGKQKTETKKLIRKECYVRREEIQQEKGNTAANINCS